MNKGVNVEKLRDDLREGMALSEFLEEKFNKAEMEVSELDTEKYCEQCERYTCPNCWESSGCDGYHEISQCLSKERVLIIKAQQDVCKMIRKVHRLRSNVESIKQRVGKKEQEIKMFIQNNVDEMLEISRKVAAIGA